MGMAEQLQKADGPEKWPSMGVSINRGTPIARWFIMDNTIKMDDLGVPLFQDTNI